MRTKIIEVAGKKYTLTANRSIIQTIARICPEMLDLPSQKTVSEIEGDAEVLMGIKVMSNIGDLFYDMIKVAHPEISREKSEDILDLFMDEYNDVIKSLMKFAMSVFTDGTPKANKKNLNW